VYYVASVAANFHAETFGTASSSLSSLAAAHPAAYCCLVDCSVRSQHFQATDILVAAHVLKHAGGILRSSSVELEAILGNPDAVTAYASAFTSVVKRAAVNIKAAGSVQAEAQQQLMHSSQPATAAAGAAQFFPAVVPDLTMTLLASMACNVSSVVAQLQLRHQANAARFNTTSRGSSSSSSSGSSNAAAQQSMASAALLAVLLARSLVVLADAMEAAAAAAGMTPAQLFAR
jgi:hypothetical protein